MEKFFKIISDAKDTTLFYTMTPLFCLVVANLILLSVDNNDISIRARGVPLDRDGLKIVSIVFGGFFSINYLSNLFNYIKNGIPNNANKIIYISFIFLPVVIAILIFYLKN